MLRFSLKVEMRDMPFSLDHRSTKACPGTRGVQIGSHSVTELVKTTPTLLALGILAAGTHFLSPATFADTKAASWRGQSITEFSPQENETMDWQIVNDGVMGGLSKGKLDFSDEGTMQFSGTLSLENNGGFSTARSSEVDLNLSNDLGLLLLVKGDGRNYEARLDSDSRFRGNSVSFSGSFETVAGEWTQVKIPFSAFEGSFRGTELPDMKLNPAVIERVWILLADKKSGPFSLEIDWIRTYGKGQGTFTERKAVSPQTRPKTSNEKEGGLIATAVADGRFTILKKALDTAGLTPFFQWDNPLTVFAPTDEAFGKLPDGVLEDLLKPKNKEKLVAVLSYHVASGANLVADALGAQEIKTVEGSPLLVRFSEGRVRVNDAVVLDGDVKASDGIIHVIDTVLLPAAPEPKTVLRVADEAGTFSTLLAAVDAAGLREVLVGEGPFTVFAPTDSAFKALPEGLVSSLLKKENRSQLVDLLKYHVVSGRTSAGDALNSAKVATLQGESISFKVEGGRLKANGATIQAADVDGGNGLIQIVDSVLLPSQFE